jgi:transcriptional regulator with XRE-family HTH domain
MMEQDIAYPRTGTTRLQELAAFLRSRREAICPEAFGISRMARRRVRGLRREEVAEAAGISAAWYTWMEQARDLKISPTTLEGLAGALRLGEEERGHLYALAGYPSPSRPQPQDEQVMVPLRAMLRGLEPNPAYALSPQWQIVAWNGGAEKLFGDLGSLEPGERNYLKLVFTSPRLRQIFLNWEEVARCCMAHFRTDTADQIDDPDWNSLVAGLKKESSTFRAWWKEHNVAWPYSWRKELALPEGRRVYKTFDLSLDRPLKLRIVTYIESQ